MTGRSVAEPGSGAPEPDREAGFVLLSVLLAAALFMAAAASFAVKSQLLAMQAANRLEQARSEAIVDGAALFAIHALQPHLGPAAAPPPAEPANAGTPAAARRRPPLPLDGTPVACALADGRALELAAIDQGGLLDLNAAPPEMIMDVLGAAGLDAETALRIAGAVADFRDEDDVPAAGGASERALYREAGKPFGPRNAPFLDAAELVQLPGLSPELAQRFLPLATVFSGRASLDPATMDRRARALFPKEIDALDALRRWRKPSPREALAIESRLRRPDGTVAALRHALATVADPLAISGALPGAAPSTATTPAAPRILQWQTAVEAPSPAPAPSTSPLCKSLVAALGLGL
jgi:general secretion pathway protein K